MNSSLKKILLSLMFVGCTGCAAPPPAGNSPPAEEKEYVTGSNIPRRDKSMPSDVKVVDPSAIEDIRGRGTATGPGKGVGN